MRPQDVVILLKIIALNGVDWQLVTLSKSLHISLSEISESLNRSRQAMLIDYNKKNVNRGNLMEFLEHGMKFVFPQQLGTLTRGIPTAHTHPLIKEMFISETNYILPHYKGSSMGLALAPLYAKQIEAMLQDEQLYFLLALVDMIRIGRVREIKFAVAELKKRILNEPLQQ